MNMRHGGVFVAASLLIVTGLTVASNKSANSVHPVLAEETASVPPSLSQPTDRPAENYQGSFLYTSASAMLAAEGVTIYPEDKVFAFPDPSLGIGSHIQVYRAQQVRIQDGDNSQSIRSWAPTVQALLQERRIPLGNKDIVQPVQQTPISLSAQPFVITITRVAESQLVTKEPIDYTTTYTDDSTLQKGSQVIDQAGKTGTLQKTYLIHQENGLESWRKLIDQTVTVKPVNEIIRRGTKVVDYGTGGASWYSGVPALTAAHRTLPMGTHVRVINLDNGKSVMVTIADRGPFVSGRIIDLSADAFAQIASPGSGVITVRLEAE